MYRYEDREDPNSRPTGRGGDDGNRAMSPGRAAAGRARAWLERLDSSRLAILGAELASELARRGFAVHDAETGGDRPIATSLTPEPLDLDSARRLAADSRLLLSAAVKAAHWALGQGALAPSAEAGSGPARRLFARFTPLEMAFLGRHPDALGRVASARVDFFEGPDGGPVALEINATIPAMQGYSDILSQVVAHASRDADAWVAQAYVEPPRSRHLLLETSEMGEVVLRWRDVFTDLGVFTSLGATARPYGAASRCSTTPIVNLLGGGGMVPLVSPAALEALFPALALGPSA